MNTVQRRQIESSRRQLSTTGSAKRFATDDGVQECDQERIIGKFNSLEDAPDRFRDELPALDLPGFGQPYDDCEDDFMLVCTNCGHTTETDRTCYRSQCPKCGAWWAFRQSRTIASKLEATRLVKEDNEGSGWSGYKHHHLALSPPDGFAVDAEDPVQFTIDILKEIFDEIGVAGGVILYHPYRGVDESEGEQEISDDRGFWSDLLFNDDDQEMADIEDSISHEPHFHAIVTAKNIPGGQLSKGIHHESGWIFKRITKGGDESESNVSLYDEYDLCRATSYSLSHTGLYETKNGMAAAYRYFGETANLQPRDHTEARIDAAMRSVVPNTLGLPFTDMACRDDAPTEGAAVNRVADTAAVYAPGTPDASEATDGDSDGVDGEPDLMRDDDVEPPEDRCAGRLVPITQAPALLGDEDWRETAERVDELRQAWMEWRDRVDEPPPDAPPPPQ